MPANSKKKVAETTEKLTAETLLKKTAETAKKRTSEKPSKKIEEKAKEPEIVFVCQFCGETRPLSEMIMLRQFYPQIASCKKCSMVTRSPE